MLHARMFEYQHKLNDWLSVGQNKQYKYTALPLRTCGALYLLLDDD